MNTSEIIQEINHLPLSKKMYVIEKALHAIQIETTRSQMELAAESLHDTYHSDSDLTAFTALDLEHFYEAK